MPDVAGRLMVSFLIISIDIVLPFLLHLAMPVWVINVLTLFKARFFETIHIFLPCESLYFLNTLFCFFFFFLATGVTLQKKVDKKELSTEKPKRSETP